MWSRRTRRAQAELQAVLDDAELNEGDIGDGGLMIVDRAGELYHHAPAEITSALRYAVARMATSDKGGIASRVAVTSALSGEGVTYVSQTLAAILANDLRRNICLVDLNWWSASGEATASRGPSSSVDPDAASLRTVVTSSNFRRSPASASPHRVGAAQVINGTATLSEAFVRTMNPALTILPAGFATVAERAVLAQSTSLAELLDVLETKFDHLILDLPPVLTTSETPILASLAEAYILVVRQGVTAEHQVQSALHEMRHLAALGVVLNRASSHVPKRILHVLAV